MIIDFHTHIFPPDVCRNRGPYLERDSWFRLLYSNPRARMVTADELVASMDAAGIDKAVTFNFGWTDPGLCRLGNDYVIESARKYPDRLVPFAVVSPGAPNETGIEIERVAAAGMRGIGELTPAGQGFDVEDERVMGATVEAAQHYGLPILLHANEQVGHAYAGKGEQAPWGIIQLARRFPGATFVAAHWGGGLFAYELMPELFSALQNVYYDTSASLLLYRDLIFRVAMQIAPRKVLFATDYPLLNQRAFLRRVRVAGLPAESERLLLGENARRLLATSGETDGH